LAADGPHPALPNSLNIAVSANQSRVLQAKSRRSAARIRPDLGEGFDEYGQFYVLG
jgi:hypothetical protein